MARKHIKRDYSAHKKSVVRPVGEYCKLEIFSYDHPQTMYYSLYEGNVSGDNIKEGNCLSWRTLESANATNRFQVDCPYSVDEFGEYRIDVLYQTKSDYDYTGFLQIFEGDNQIVDDTVMFDGETNIVKRLTGFYELEQGEYKFRIRLPVNCHFMGAIIRKIKYFSGDSIDSAGTNLMFLSSTVSKSSSVKPAEASVTVGYDDDFECPSSESGFFMDYRDEMNIYIKDEEDEIKQIFGGYLSSILPDADRTKLTITCADRLIDGQNKYVLDSMYLLGGTTVQEEYDDELYHNFNSYGEALKFLCDTHEVTLQNNINENYLVAGESYENGLAVTFGSSGNALNVHGANMDIQENMTFICVRNQPSAEEFQSGYIYDVRDYGIDPVEITDFPNFYITYGLGDPKRDVEGGGSSGGGVVNPETGLRDNSGAVIDPSTHIVINSDNINGGEYAMMQECASRLAELGYTNVEITGVDPNLHYTDFFNMPDNSVMFCIFGGMCAGTLWEQGTDTFTSHMAQHNKQIVDGFVMPNYRRDPSKHLDNLEYLGRAWDDNFSSLDGLDHPGQYLTSHGVNYVYGDNGRELAENLVGGGSAGIPVDEIFREISDEAFRYNYCLSCGSSTIADLLMTRNGDCWAFSEFIFTKLKERGVTCKIVEYATSESSNHRSVMYGDTDGNWIDFPYREYGWGERYNNMLNNTSGSSSGSVVASFEGNGVNTATGTVAASKMSVGYDKDKPFQFYIDFVFSIDKQKTYDYVLNVTQVSNHANSYGRINPIWINNVVKQANIRILDYMADIVGDSDLEEKYYIHQIKLKAGKQAEPFYTSDENNVDESSCKMDLYGVGFNNGTIINPTDLSSCGKSITTEMEQLVKDSGYLVDMEYALHRKDDVINFKVDNQSEPTYTATEGNDNNILSWGSISYTPVSNLFNNSIYVYKKIFENGTYYRFVNAKDSNSVLRYGEQTTLQTNSEVVSDKEAYYNARKKSDKFNPRETFSYTITVPFSPDINIGDLVKVVADAKKLNTIKRVESVKYTYDYSKIPRLQTTIGLNELEPDLQLKKTLREMREATKQESTLFSTTAKGIDDPNVYQWEK